LLQVEEKVGDPERQAIDDDDAPCERRVREDLFVFDVRPTRVAIAFVAFDARGVIVVEAARRREVDGALGEREGSGLGVTALARAGRGGSSSALFRS
jgi:hypothetical protein